MKINDYKANLGDIVKITLPKTTTLKSEKEISQVCEVVKQDGRIGVLWGTNPHFVALSNGYVASGFVPACELEIIKSKRTEKQLTALAISMIGECELEDVDEYREQAIFANCTKKAFVSFYSDGEDYVEEDSL